MHRRVNVPWRIEYLLIMIMFGCMGPVVRVIHLPTPVIANLRAWISALFLILIIVASGKAAKLKDVRPVLFPMIICGICLAGDWIGLFEAYQYTTVATATVSYYMTPVFVFAASPLVLKERFTWKHVLCIIVAFTGMVFVSGVVENGIPKLSEIKGVLFSLLGAVSYSTVVLINKKYPEGDPVTKTAVQLLATALLTTPYILFTSDFRFFSVTGKDILFLLILGIVFTALLYIRYFTVIVEIPARTVAILSYADPVVAVIISVFFLNEPMTIYGVIGAVLIIGSAIVSEI